MVDIKYSKSHILSFIILFSTFYLYFLVLKNKNVQLNLSEGRTMFCGLEFWHMINVTVCLSTFSERINNSISFYVPSKESMTRKTLQDTLSYIYATSLCVSLPHRTQTVSYLSIERMKWFKEDHSIVST